MIQGLKIQKLSEKKPGVKLLAYGPPGVGKTVFSCLGPDKIKTLFVDVEGGTLSLENFNVGDVVDVVKVTKFQDIFDIHKYLLTGEHEYGTVVVDSLTELQKKSMDGIVEAAYKKDPTKRDPDVAQLADWGKNTAQLRKAVRYFRDLPMNVIFTALEKESKDESTGAIRIGPDLTPKLQNDVAGYLDIIGHMSRKEKEGEGDFRQMLVQPTGKYMAKDRSGKFERVIINPTFKYILGKIDGTIPVDATSETLQAKAPATTAPQA